MEISFAPEGNSRSNRRRPPPGRRGLKPSAEASKPEEPEHVEAE